VTADVELGVWFVTIDQKGAELCRCLERLLALHVPAWDSAQAHRDAEAAVAEWKEPIG
jgi:hypothetical protein